jgi:hypothetical protein
MEPMAGPVSLAIVFKISHTRRTQIPAGFCVCPHVLNLPFRCCDVLSKQVDELLDITQGEI